MPAAAQIGEETTPVFIMSELRELLMNDEELIRVVILGFLDDIPVRIQELKGNLKDGNIRDAERQAHTIKGAAANLGAQALRTAAGEIEKHGREENIPAMQTHVAELERQFLLLKEQLKNVIPT